MAATVRTNSNPFDAWIIRHNVSWRMILASNDISLTIPTFFLSSSTSRYSQYWRTILLDFKRAEVLVSRVSVLGKGHDVYEMKRIGIRSSCRCDILLHSSPTPLVYPVLRDCHLIPPPSIISYRAAIWVHFLPFLTQSRCPLTKQNQTPGMLGSPHSKKTKVSLSPVNACFAWSLIGKTPQGIKRKRSHPPSRKSAQACPERAVSKDRNTKLKHPLSSTTNDTVVGSSGKNTNPLEYWAKDYLLPPSNPWI